MEEKLLVRIFVPTADGKARVGTGYPVARDRILTARHVLTPSDRDPNQAFQVQWPHAAGPTTTANIRWQGGPDLDAAVLECPFPPSVNTWGILSESRPAVDSRWQSRGFARAGKTATERKLIGMTGRVLAVRENQARLELGVEFSPEQREAWQGASGSPVFIQGRICGIVAACEENFRGNRLEATAVCRLLEVPEFRAAVDYDDRANLLAQIRRDVAGRLESSPVAMEVLGRELNVHDPRTTAALCAGDLADALLRLPAEELIRKTYRAHRDLFDRRGLRVRDDGGAIEEVACLLLPVVFDSARVQSVRTLAGRADAALVSFPAATSSLAEIIMAGVDRRPALFFPAGGETDLPDGKLRLPLPPECGRDPKGQGFQQAWHKHLAEKFVPLELRGRYRKEDKVLTRIAADELDHLAHDGQTHYFILDPSDGDLEHRAWTEIIRELKTLYPAIVFIDLRHDGEQAAEECTLLRPLRDLLWQSRKG